MAEIPSFTDFALKENLRERKRRETRQRVAEAGKLLFINNGFNGTTIEVIAIEAGISRRIFFILQI